MTIVIFEWNISLLLELGTPFPIHFSLCGTEQKHSAKHLLCSNWIKRIIRKDYLMQNAINGVPTKCLFISCKAWYVQHSLLSCFAQFCSAHTVKFCHSWVWQNHYPSQGFTSSFCLSLNLTTNFLTSKTFILKFSALLRVCCPLTHPHAYTDESAHSCFSPHMRACTHTARFSAYRSAENTHTRTHTTFASFSHSEVTRWWALAVSYHTLVFHPCLIPLFSPTRPPTHLLSRSSILSLSRFGCFSVSLEWQSERTVEANYSSAVLVSVLYKIRVPSAVCKRQTSLLLCVSLDSRPAIWINFSYHSA